MDFGRPVVSKWTKGPRTSNFLYFIYFIFTTTLYFFSGIDFTWFTWSDLKKNES